MSRYSGPEYDAAERIGRLVAGVFGLAILATILVLLCSAIWRAH